jgi:hypothetical protein
VCARLSILSTSSAWGCLYCTEAIICYCIASFVQNLFRCLTSKGKIEDWDRQIHGFRGFGTLFIFPCSIGYWYSLEASPKAKFYFFYDPKLQFKRFPFLAKPYSQFLISSFSVAISSKPEMVRLRVRRFRFFPFVSSCQHLNHTHLPNIKYFTIYSPYAPSPP